MTTLSAMAKTETAKRWRAEGLGPRQAKRLEKALTKLRSERHQHTRITGVVGGEENRYSVFTPFGGGPVNDAAVAAFDAVGERFGWVATPKTLKAVEEALAAALEASRAGRKVVDERRTPEQEAEIQQRIQANNAEVHEQQRRVEANHAALLAKAPAGATALITAELDEDKCDLMTDYFAHSTSRVVAIGWRFSAREDFRRLREVAAAFPETAHLGPDAVKEVEHRDNYSMGSGNYLKAGHTHDSGWRVRSHELKYRHGLPSREIEDALPAASATAEPAEAREVGGATVSASEKNPANVEVRFASKPGADVRDELKGAGFRWSPRFGCWYGRREALPARYQGGIQ